MKTILAMLCLFGLVAGMAWADPSAGPSAEPSDAISTMLTRAFTSAVADLPDVTNVAKPRRWCAQADNEVATFWYCCVDGVVEHTFTSVLVQCCVTCDGYIGDWCPSPAECHVIDLWD
jgi:hypothetical protein